MSKNSDKPKQRGRPRKDPTTPAGTRSNAFLSGRVNWKVMDAFMGYIDDFNKKHGLRTDKTTHLEKAVVMYLHAMGVKIEGLPPYLQMLYGEEE